MPLYNRKSDPKVVGGKVQRKNNQSRTPRYAAQSTGLPSVERQNPGKGYRHLVTRRHLEQFLALLPDWAELSIGLNAVVLAAGDEGCDGWHQPGVVAVCAWERDLWRLVGPDYFQEHAGVFVALGVESARAEDGHLLQFTAGQAAAYQLLHVLLHELGHHHDRMTTRSGRRASRGEGFAEQYAHRYAARIWERYESAFGPLGPRGALT